MANLIGDKFVNGKRVEVIEIDPTGKSGSQITTELNNFLNASWPTASGYTHAESTMTEICGFGFPWWYLQKVLNMISVACHEANGNKICVITITQP